MKQMGKGSLSLTEYFGLCDFLQLLVIHQTWCASAVEKSKNCSVKLLQKSSNSKMHLCMLQFGQICYSCSQRTFISLVFVEWKECKHFRRVYDCA